MNSKDQPIQRRLTRVATTATASWLVSHTLPLIDRILYRFTQGRHTLLPLISHLSVVMLTTTGAKTGAHRTIPVVAVAMGSDLIIVASNYGKPNHPAWYYNLLANPGAYITRDRETFEVDAHEALGDEREDCWQLCVRTFPGWEVYDDRTHRHIPVMVLRPTT